MRSLYIHIPFCERKCLYCDFCSSVYTDEIKNKYVDKLIHEIQSKGTQEKLKSVFIGGGTPSLLDLIQINKIMDEVNKSFGIDKNTEVTIECNPNSIDEEKMIEYRKLGINRIGLGVQVLDDEILKLIGRVHKCIDVYRVAEKISKYFDNYNFDIMIGLPNLSSLILKNTIQKLLEFKPTHISMYSLILEENTKLYELVKNKKIILPNDDEVVKQYELGMKILCENNFHRYEISNFCKCNFESKHNLNYWQCGEYYGVGLSAHSYLNNQRFCNTNNIYEYLESKDYEPVFLETLSNKEKIEERIMLGLRLEDGIDITNLKKELNYDLMSEKQTIINELIRKNFIIFENNRIKIYPDKFYISNQIIEQLI